MVSGLTCREHLRAYRLILIGRMRAQTSYRTSFALDALGSLCFTLVSFAEIWVIFQNVRVLGGLNFSGLMVVFGLSGMAYSLADTLFGHLMTLSDYLRLGTIDVWYLRPLSLLGQAITADLTLRRFVRLAIGAVLLGLGMARTNVPPSLHSFAVVISAFLGGCLLYSALFVASGAVQFFVIDGQTLSYAITYAGRYAADQPASIWPAPLRVLFTFVIPTAFVGYLPTVTLLGLPGTPLLPTWLGWLTLPVGLWCWVLALLLWNRATHHYQGGGG